MSLRLATVLGTFALLSLLPRASGAQTIDPAAFASLEGSSFKVMSYEECKASYFNVDFGQAVTSPFPHLGSARPLSEDEKWVPTGQPEQAEPIGCAPEDLERLYLDNRQNTRAQGQRLQKWFGRCSEGLKTELANGALPGPRAHLKSSQMAYEFCDHPNIRKVVFKLPNGDVVRAALGIKAGWTPRPMIIAKCGMLCNAGDSGMQLLLMHLFDESPFNIMVVGNNTGADFIRDNGVFIPGGFTEGQQIIHVAQMLQASPLAPLISTIHVVGLSLGGHASLYAAYFNRFNSTPGQPLISSTLALCPAVDLRAAIDDNFSIDLKGFAINSLYGKSIDRVLESRPELAGLFTWQDAPVMSRTDMIGDQAVNGLKHSTAKSWLAPFQKLKIRNARDFWGLNLFTNFVKEPLASPTLAIAAADDEVVLPNRNILRLDHTSVANAVTPEGDHCVWGEFYGWRTSSALFRGFALSQSPELLEIRRLQRLPFKPVFAAKAHQLRGLHRLTSFSFSAGRDRLTVTYLLDTSACGSEEETRCSRKVSFNIPFASFRARPWWARKPASPAEAQALTRWANVNLRMLDASGAQIDGTENNGAELVWVGYGEES